MGISQVCGKFISKVLPRSVCTKPVNISKINISELRLAANKAETCSFRLMQAKTPLTKTQILNIKPSEFESMLGSRTDVPDELRKFITSPEKLGLYDELNTIMASKKIPVDKRKKLLDSFLHGNVEADAQRDVLPKLIEKGYDLEMLSKLHIRNHNKNQVEVVLGKNEIINSMVDSHIDKEFTHTSKIVRYMNKGKNEDYINKRLAIALQDLDTKRPEFRLKKINEILSFVDDKNVKFLDECFNTTGGVMLLPYWQKDSSEIYKLLTNVEYKCNTFDRIFRRGHNIDSVQRLAKDGELNDITERLLEFRNYEKFKNIDTETFKNLSVRDKKEFLNSFISSIGPKEILWDSSTKLSKNINQLSSKMKIFKEIEAPEKEKVIENYTNLIKKMLDEIPTADRMPITKKIKYGDYRAEYRANNPIPPMTDDISKLETKIETLNGKNYKTVQLKSDTQMGIATHRMPNGNAILNVEALEITDPNAILCIGLKGGSRKLNFNKSDYALAVKPRQANDWWLQSYTDIDSGNNATKNIFNIEKYVLRTAYADCHVGQSVSYIPELIKKELNLSQLEYTTRMKALGNARTLDEIKKIDPEFENAVRKVVRENNTYEGLIRPEVMGICIDSNKPLSEVNPNILNYCELRDIPLIRILD